MPFPPDDPDRIYTDPVDWHPAPIYRIHGPASPGAHNYTPDFTSDSGGPVMLFASNTANGLYNEAFGGPHPGLDAASCLYSWNVIGHDLDGGLWSGVCPDVADGPSTTYGVHRSSVGEATYVVTGGPGADQAEAFARISGWLYRSWLTHLFDNPYADDPTLEAEYNAAIAASSPGPGWFLEAERNYPFFVKNQFAPDEVVSTTGQVRTDNARWFRAPFEDEEGDVWAYHGIDNDGNGIWTTGALPNGTVLADYSGGVAPWVDPPAGWQPEQDLSSQFFTGWLNVPETDEELAAESIPLTLAAESVYNGTFPGSATKGRTGQWLMVRAEYRLPQIRWYRERTITPPRRILGRPHPGRIFGDNTVQNGRRALGGIL